MTINQGPGRVNFALAPKAIGESKEKAWVFWASPTSANPSGPERSAFTDLSRGTTLLRESKTLVGLSTDAARSFSTTEA